MTEYYRGWDTLFGNGKTRTCLGSIRRLSNNEIVTYSSLILSLDMKQTDFVLDVVKLRVQHS